MINKIIERIAYKKPNKKYDLETILNHVVENTKYYSVVPFWCTVGYRKKPIGVMA